MKFIEVTFNNIKTEIENALKVAHNKANIIFSVASPYGQILSVVEDLHQLSFLYLKNAINQFDLSSPNSLNERNVKNAAILSGHIPTRSISSTGTLRFSVRGGVDLEKDLPGSQVSFSNKLNIKNKTNGLDYSFNLGSEKITNKIDNNSQFYVSIIQGKWDSEFFTGTGENLLTRQISINSKTKDIENFNIEVIVNGELWTNKKALFDMLPDEKACVVRTGFNGTVDIIFGNSDFGMIPPLAAIIEVKYLISDGSNGNIFRRTVDDWNFVGNMIDGNGNSIDVSKIFKVEIYNDINFGADKESVAFTKSLLPMVSNNFVLGLPQQYAYELKKLGVFSHVNAYEKSGSIFIVATPNINLFKNQNSDYFSINLNAFKLDTYEKSKIDKYLKSSGNIQLTKKYKIDTPTLSYYAVNIFVIPYSNVTDDSLNSQILNTLSNYFLNLSRTDRIPKLDIIKELSKIEDIHSVDIQFICKKNEDYHKENIIKKFNMTNNTTSSDNLTVKNDPNYISNQTLGLDSTLGDILFEPNELPILRGDWYDRNGVYYSDSIYDTGMKSVNIIKKGVIDSSKKNK